MKNKKNRFVEARSLTLRTPFSWWWYPSRLASAKFINSSKVLIKVSQVAPSNWYPDSTWLKDSSVAPDLIVCTCWFNRSQYNLNSDFLVLIKSGLTFEVVIGINATFEAEVIEVVDDIRRLCWRLAKLALDDPNATNHCWRSFSLLALI